MSNPDPDDDPPDDEDELYLYDSEEYDVGDIEWQHSDWNSAVEFDGEVLADSPYDLTITGLQGDGEPRVIVEDEAYHRRHEFGYTEALGVLIEAGESR